MTRDVRLCLLGFGAVGQALMPLLAAKAEWHAHRYDARVRVSGIYTPSRGALVSAPGLDAGDLVGVTAFAGHPAYRSDLDALGTLDTSGADVLVELSPLSIADGQPAITHIDAALRAGRHVITANKGPEAHDYRRLRALADERGLAYLHETAVMDGTPVFNLVTSTLPGCTVLGLRGVLNSTTNYVLGVLERGGSVDEAIAEAQAAGFAEADPSLDLDGWDGAAKITALANVLMGCDLRPQDVERVPLATVDADALAAARERGMTVKYLCTARRPAGEGAGGEVPGRDVTLRVAPELVPLSDPLALVTGTSSILTITTDLAGPITVTQHDPTIEQTAYGVFSDLCTLLAST